MECIVEDDIEGTYVVRQTESFGLTPEQLSKATLLKEGKIIFCAVRMTDLREIVLIETEFGRSPHVWVNGTWKKALPNGACHD